ncbi:MAG TPA: phosphomannomutase/phosphoglucomutase [Candidatus Angelobacter sp.]|nr:phosphomannomutase/phosphoglucomutase [Candidatus Angelobacter sp.]
MLDAALLDRLIKAYDVRGVVPDDLSPEIARLVGAAFVRVLGVGRGDGGPGAVVVGRDMRPSGPELVAAFSDGVTSQGVDVVDIGLASTDELYFAAGSLELPGAMFTASHNPAQYNGIKLCRTGAAPVGQDTGLSEIRELVLAWSATGLPAYDGAVGTVSHRDLLADYAAFLNRLVPLGGGRHLDVVVDAGNGMGGHTVPAVLAGLPLSITPLYFELDGTFPNHEANPIEPANLRDLQAKVLETGADLGLAFDGDADRCFVVDERGAIVNPSTLTALIAVRELAKDPGATIIHNLITSVAVPEIVREHGGVPVRTRVGHSFIKATMAETGAVFGGEHSGHFYFRDFWRADSGMLAALHTLAALGETPPGTTLSSLLAQYTRYASSGEINTKVDDQTAVLEQITATYGGRDGVTLDGLDGLTVTGGTDDRRWWFNVRGSNTEPLLRLNVEGADDALMATVRDETLAIIRGGAA